MRRASRRERVEISVGLECGRLLFGSGDRATALRPAGSARARVAAGVYGGSRGVGPSPPHPRCEERRVGKEWRSRWDWSADVCSSDRETELLHFGLPDLRGLESRPAYTAEAAE